MSIIRFKEKTPRLNKEYADYLRGKTVCIVGRSEEALENNVQGEFIDSHDVVVRMHDMRPYRALPDGKGGIAKIKTNPWRPLSDSRPLMRVPDGWRPRVGSKAQILFVCCIVENLTDEQKQRCFAEETEIFRANGGRFLCAEDPVNHNGLSELVWQESYPIRYLSHEHWLCTKRMLRSISSVKPFGGGLIALDVLRNEIKSLYMTGMPCMLNPDTIDTLRDFDFQVSQTNLRLLINLADDYPDTITIDDNMREMWDMALVRIRREEDDRE